jgi:hypothetical protein
LASAGLVRSTDLGSASICAVIFSVLPHAREAADQAMKSVFGASGPKMVITGNLP